MTSVRVARGLEKFVGKKITDVVPGSMLSRPDVVDAYNPAFGMPADRKGSGAASRCARHEQPDDERHTFVAANSMDVPTGRKTVEKATALTQAPPGVAHTAVDKLGTHARSHARGVPPLPTDLVPLLTTKHEGQRLSAYQQSKAQRATAAPRPSTGVSMASSATLEALRGSSVRFCDT